ncbi:MAG TPA: hypothetical protein PLU87_02885 [Sedimentisphaerales bacterium]|nr:hypothetical protein [Sedimentisphaerales bacterium]HRS09968.1 hypothetical protein [Sedimentisphaerales bacterium]HRV46674.1 hypothetical protein [Sedimentisphaerales bacterium]
MENINAIPAWGIGVLLVCLSSFAGAETVVTWDFTQGAQGWTGNNFVEDLTAGSEGLAFGSTGIDPWLEGPAVDLPEGSMTRVTVTMKSDADSGGELFYGRHFEAGRSVRFMVTDDGQWHDYALMIREPLGSGTRFRLDPATGPGSIVVRSIRVESLAAVAPPPLKKPQRLDAARADLALVQSGDLLLRHSPGRWGDFLVECGGTEMAAGHASEIIGIMLDGQPQWLDLSSARLTCDVTSGGLTCVATLTDSDGGHWRLTRQVSPGRVLGTLVVDTEFVTDRDREVVYLPWLTVFAGLDTFGPRKTQGLLAGLEYLEDEPSSSEADIRTPEHVRRVPDPIKITFPLMAIAHQDRYVGLIWEPSDLVAPVFDSPDTIYGSGAGVMALTAPAVGDLRFENDLAAHTPFRLPADRPLRSRIVIIGGEGQTIVPAVEKYVQVRGLLPVPVFEGGFDAAVTLLAHGWLDSAINEGGLFRHAVWGSAFRPQPACDAPVYMDWLARHCDDIDLAGRLHDAHALALSKLPAGGSYWGTVSHVRTPTPALVLGNVESYVRLRQSEAVAMLKNFDAQGIKHYQPGKVDYSRGHFTYHANGLAAADVTQILEAATLSADPRLIEQGLALLDKQTDLYAGTVPRGAQTWEVPLHTPDILASAYMVKAYTLGFVLSGRPDYLEQARYWAWTGVPFVYLANPTKGAVGPYATIAVLGATNWKAPIWFGQPVQWCGLVYGSALHQLAQYDSSGPWRMLAKAITATGLHMTWPESDPKRQGLLPDFFHLRAQISDGPAINPGTVQAHLPELFAQGRLYDVRRIEGRNWFIHAPCEIGELRPSTDSVSFEVAGWGDAAFTVLISGVPREPSDVTVRMPDGDVIEAGTHYDAELNLLTLTLSGPSEIQLHQ